MKGEINTVYLIETNNPELLKGVDNRYHYFYKIVHNDSGNYYYGIHTTDNIDDNYKGSGYRLHNAYKKHGLQSFTKYVIKFFDSRKDLLNYEKQIVTYELCNEMNCYNIIPGGQGPDSLYIHVVDKNGNNVQITRSEFKNNPDMYIHHSKGRIVLNNGIMHKYVLPNELDKYLSNGWVKGEIEHSTLGRISVVKENKQRYVLPNELDKYLSNGWVKGGLSRNKFVKSQIKGFVWITNGKKQIRISKDELDKYVKLGWTTGICQKTTKGYVKLTNNIDNISVDPNNIEQINHYLGLGWKYGVTRDVQKHIWINDTINSKMILYSELQKYLDEGWVKGRLKKDMPAHKPNIKIVSKNGIAIQINESDLQKYLDDDWVKGNCNINPVTNNGKIVINKDGKNKFIYPNELQKYLDEGWVKGKLKK